MKISTGKLVGDKTGQSLHAGLWLKDRRGWERSSRPEHKKLNRWLHCCSVRALFPRKAE
jgi:hypothetical protein